MTVRDWLILLAIFVAIGSFATAWLALKLARGARNGGPADAPAPESAPDSYAFIVNPSKTSTIQFRSQVLAHFARHGLAAPSFYETTKDDPGRGQAARAIAEGATVVVAAGGDGTVRSVAGAVAAAGAIMGLVPLGTGNLLARNIDIDVTSVPSALSTVTFGATRPIDLGMLRVVEAGDDVPHGADAEPEPFLVIGGIGFDGAMVADTSSTLKERVGWLAYFFAAFRHLHARRPRMRIRIDQGRVFTVRLRTILIGNCGRLPGGLNLIPDAVIDDGRLDVAALDARGGLAGWAQLFGEVVMQGLGIRNSSPKKIGRIDHVTATRIAVRVLDGTEPVQVDGDTLGAASKIEAWIEPQALRVRAPAAS